MKSGGYGAFAGASNTAGGIAIDLTQMVNVTLSDDLSTVGVGPGNRWADVYEALEGSNLTVVGGMVGDVGVGGLTLGGTYL